ncbi:hypothetical protein [Pleurocapsa sp. FMAR1]|uniref:hypothetical protein n=1 Tax=Pleurocapsa sp. FMAR1 TaxID=3040204 RepID=UPI0029C8DEE7|nr:hypothetical protein [Pleurocapsa sp. FMAR1]
MLRDASHRQVIQKFSFIQSLNLSRQENENNQTSADQAVISQPKETSTLFSQANLKDSSSATMVAATIDTSWYGSDGDTDFSGLNLAEIVKYSSLDNSTDGHQPKNHDYLGKILFSLAISYCLFVLWWLFGHQVNQLLTTWTGGKYFTISKSDEEFINYAERSLEAIDRQLETSKTEADKQEQLVYVPVYTPPTTPSLPPVSNLPLTAPSNNTPQIPEPAANEPLKIPAPPPLPPATPIESESANPPEKEKTNEQIAAQPVIKNTLIGILELGANQSAALVKVDGQTKRVWVGEKINNDGWILESVGKESANISYQGQIRSISVGETF